MSGSKQDSAAAIRARLNHPVIDADGHMREFPPLMADFFRAAAGQPAVDGLNQIADALAGVYGPERYTRRVPRMIWWGSAGSTLDRATGLFPKLMYERLDELGFDFLVLFPTVGLGLAFLPDTATRRAACHAYTAWLAEQYTPYADRITPVAMVPAFTPEEAIAELEHVAQVGLKVVALSSLMYRQNPHVKLPQDARHAIWPDTLGLDSAYDYDPVWARCQELGLLPTFHTAGMGQGYNLSPSSMSFNQIGSFASANEAVCKALFLGGVTRRFPKLRFGFMEGGVSWACNLYAQLIARWKTRCAEGVKVVDPVNFDREEFVSLVAQYGGSKWADWMRGEAAGMSAAELGTALTVGRETPEPLDDFYRCGITRAEQIRDLFTPNFYFGCEAEDPIATWAFDTKVNPFGARLNAMFSSDISHFDVPDMREVLGEAYELLEDGVFRPADFKQYMFGNAVRFFTSGNPRFFAGTQVEQAAREVLAQPPAS